MLPSASLADEAVNTDFSAAGVVGVPMVVVPVFAQLSVIGSDIALQHRVVCTCGMHHDAFDGNLSSCFVAGVFRKNELI